MQFISHLAGTFIQIVLIECTAEDQGSEGSGRSQGQSQGTLCIQDAMAELLFSVPQVSVGAPACGGWP